MSSVIYGINPAGVFFVGLLILIGTVIYFIILVLLKGIEWEEVGFIKNIFRM